MTASATRLSKHLLISTILLLAQLAAVPAHAQNQITTCGTMVTEPGDYTLANDLNCSEGDGIDILSGGVTLHLNNHGITGGAAGDGISVSAPSGQVTVDGPGSIMGFSVGVNIANTPELVEVGIVASLLAKSAGFNVVASKVSLHDNAVVGSQNGFLLGTDDSEIRHNHATDILLNAFVVAGSRNRLVDNIADGNGQNGISTERGAMGNTIVTNTAANNRSYDLFEGNSTCVNVWESNRFRKANLTCIH